MSRPSCIFRPSLRTQPKPPLCHGLPVVPTRYFSLRAASLIKARLGVGKINVCACVIAAMDKAKANKRTLCIRARLFIDFLRRIIDAANDPFGFFASGVRCEHEF